MISNYVNQCRNVVYWNLVNRLQLNLEWNENIFIQESAFANVVSEMAVILSRPQCVKWPYSIFVFGVITAVWHSFSGSSTKINIDVCVFIIDCILSLMRLSSFDHTLVSDKLCWYKKAQNMRQIRARCAELILLSPSMIYDQCQLSALSSEA